MDVRYAWTLKRMDIGYPTLFICDLDQVQCPFVLSRGWDDSFR